MPSPESDFRVDPRFVAGLAALNRGDYLLAIAAFQAVIAQCGTRREGLKAHLHLVKAYAQTQQWQEAITLCQFLARVEHPHIQAWARKYLPQLELHRDAEPTAPNLQLLMPPPPSSRLRQLRPVSRWYLWVSQGLTIAVMAGLAYWAVRVAVMALTGLPNDMLALLRGWEGAIAAALVGAVALLLFGFSSSLWSLVLHYSYGLRPVSLGELSDYSPEAVTLIGSLTWSWRQPRPQLQCLMSAAPVIFSYGCWRRRIVVSEGLLRSLSPQELAALLAVELAQLRQGLHTLITPLVLVLQVPYAFYHRFSGWGDRWAPPYGRDWGRRLGAMTLYTACALLSQGSYLLFRGLEMLLFWSNQLRQYYSDRQGAVLAGNPNTLVLAWLRLMHATAETVRHQGSIGAAMESLRLLLPLNPTQAALWGEQPIDWGAIARWDGDHPLRWWFRCTSSHRPLGLRLRALMAYSRRWKLPCLLLVAPQSSGPLQRGWQQLTPLWGAIAGVLLALLLTAVGQFAFRLGQLGFALWWLTDWQTLGRSLSAVGLGVGLFLRINAYYPTLGDRPQVATLSQLLHRSLALPLDSTPVRLEGRLCAVTGLRNGLGQHLWLQTANGLWLLRCYRPWGSLWLILAPQHLETLRGRSLTVEGWFRRGTVPMVEVAQWHCPDLKQTQSWQAPYWAIVVASLWVLYGILTLLGWL
ncbi:zinc metalloprotease HtpX [Thermosynechococcaceae cyanobacterium Okahandja]